MGFIRQSLMNKKIRRSKKAQINHVHTNPSTSCAWLSRDGTQLPIRRLHNDTKSGSSKTEESDQSSSSFFTEHITARRVGSGSSGGGGR